MGYEVRVLRGPNWWENEGYEISEAEWQRVVEADAAMRMSGTAEAAYPEGVLRYESPSLVEWTGHPSGRVVWLDFRGGMIVVNNPDNSIIVKMQDIARRLGGRVQGDEGEFYD